MVTNAIVMTPWGWGVEGSNKEEINHDPDRALVVKANERLTRFKATGLRHVRDWACLCWLLKKKCVEDSVCQQLPRLDHPRAYRNSKTGERVWLHQPYIANGSKRADDLKALRTESEAYAALHNLSVRVSDEDSWHAPGRTVLVEFRKL